MPAGAEVLNEDGVVIVGLTDHHPRILGVRTMVEGSETVSVPEFSNGVPFVFTSFVNSLNSAYLEAGAIHASSVVTTSAGFTWSTTSKEALNTGMPSFGNGVAVYGVSNEQ